MFYTWMEPPTTVDKNELGGKGAGLFEMRKAGVPVPEFVVIPTDLCVEYMAKPAETKMKVKAMVPKIIKTFTDQFGYLPLLSVRSGARISMPGMMDTILNVGIGDQLCQEYLAKLSMRSKEDCTRRFYHMFGSTVLGIPDSQFEAEMERARKKASVETDAELDASQLGMVCERFAEVVKANNADIPFYAREQIEACILAVMDSWMSDRAIAYRRENKISDEWGTAVVIQRMVFGNMNDNSSSGVLFSRCPATGKNELTGEFLPNAQGEDVVAGIRTPLPLSELPMSVMGELNSRVCELEDQYRDMLDIEFTVEDGVLYFLQVRTAKRSARAWVRSTLDMYESGHINRKNVYDRIKRDHVRLLSRPVVDPKFKEKPHLTGLPACAGVVTGIAVFTKEQAIAAKEPCILIRHETSPDDIAGMYASVGILTATGGATSHAAVVARGMDKVCVTGCFGLVAHDNCAYLNGSTKPIAIGSKVTLDGSTGNVWFDVEVPVSDPTSDDDLANLIDWLAFDHPNTADVALPGSPGTLYYASQFLADVPPPTSKNITIISSIGDDSDPLMTLTGDIAKTAAEKGADWFAEHKVTAKFIDGQAKTLDDLLDRPVRIEEIETVLGGSVDALRKLVAPAKLEDKFTMIGCARHRLMTAFK